MKYGQYLNQNAIPEWRGQYLQYQKVADILEGPLLDDRSYIRVITDELDRLDRFVGGRVVEIVGNMKVLDASQTDSNLMESTAKLLENLDTFLSHNMEGVRKIMKKYEKKTGFSKGWYEETRSERWMVKAASMIHELLVQLSTVYKIQIEGTNTDEKWTPPASFSRRTSKYWVAQESLTKIKLFIMKHLPILELHSSSQVNVKFEDQDIDQIHNHISSVYLDNDKFDCYHERIQQIEGAQLFRVRWYGGKMDIQGALPIPNESKLIYVERKTHHEKWVGDKSTKERFPFDFRLLKHFFSGSISAEKAFEIMDLQGMASAKDLAKHIELASEVQASVIQRKLLPKIRTVYHRTAFQRSNSNQVRISLDAPCFFIKQQSEGFDRSVLHVDNDINPFEFGILEIKLVGDETPPWIDELLNRGWLQNVDKFSKFQMSVATHYSPKVRIFPHWIESMQAPRKYSLEYDDDVKLEQPKIAPEVDDTGINEDALNPNQHRQVPNSSDKLTRRKSTQDDNARRESIVLKRTNLQRTKIEPKTYFANERTFIQWLSAAILLVTLSTAVMSINETARIAGTVFFPVALIFMFYALGVYQWRLGKINRRDGTRFDDPYGPWILTILLSVAMVATVTVMWTQDLDDTSSLGQVDLSAENVAAPLPLAFLPSRRSRCPATPLQWFVKPTSWKLQENLSVDRFAEFQKRGWELFQLENRIRQFYHVTKLQTTWEKTEDLYCIPALYNCSEHYVRYRYDTHEAIIEQSDVNSNVNVPMVASASGNEYRANYEVDSLCHRNYLSHSLQIQYNETVSPHLNDTDMLNTLLEDAFYPSGYSMIFAETRYAINYEYQVREAAIGGADGAVNLEIVYGSSDERALAINPMSVKLEVKIHGVVGATSVLHAEALLEYLATRTSDTSDTSSEGLSNSTIVTISVLSFICILGLSILVMKFYRSGFGIQRFTGASDSKSDSKEFVASKSLSSTV